MRALRSPLSAKALLLLSASRFIGALAGPSINVALRASFDSAPYLVELLYVESLCDSYAANPPQRNCSRRELHRILSPPRSRSGRLLRQSENVSRTLLLIRRSASVRRSYYRSRDTLVFPIRAFGQVSGPTDRGALPILQYFSRTFATSRAGGGV
jgi:hypothetical protein